MSFHTVADLPLRVVGVEPPTEITTQNWFGRNIKPIMICIWNSLKRVCELITQLVIRIFSLQSKKEEQPKQEERIRKEGELEFPKVELADLTKEKESEENHSPKRNTPVDSPKGNEDPFYEGD